MSARVDVYTYIHTYIKNLNFISAWCDYFSLFLPVFLMITAHHYELKTLLESHTVQPAFKGNRGI